MLCPHCKTSGAYVGIVHIECPNRACQHFSEKCITPIICDDEDKCSDCDDCHCDEDEDDAQPSI